MEQGWRDVSMPWCFRKSPKLCGFTNGIPRIEQCPFPPLMEMGKHGLEFAWQNWATGKPTNSRWEGKLRDCKWKIAVHKTRALKNSRKRLLSSPFHRYLTFLCAGYFFSLEENSITWAATCGLEVGQSIDTGLLVPYLFFVRTCLRGWEVLREWIYMLMYLKEFSHFFS